MRPALLVLLGASAIVDLALGAWAGLGWRGFSNFWMPGVDLSGREPRMLGFILAFFLVYMAALQVIAIRWVRAEKAEGHVIAISRGIFLVCVGLAVFLRFQRWDILWIDGLRGAALVALGFLTLNEPSTVRTLRLPDAKTRERESRRREPSRERGREQGRDRGRDRERGRRGPGRGGERDGRGARRSSGRTGRGERGEAAGPRPAARAAGAEAPVTGPPEAGRSLAVVVKGEYKSRLPGDAAAPERGTESDPIADGRGTAGGERADDSAGGRRRKRRRRGSGRGERGERGGASSVERERESELGSERSSASAEPAAPSEPRRRVEAAPLFGESSGTASESERAGDDDYGRIRRPVRRGRRESPGGAAEREG